jgi:hypothetical protein
MRRLALLTLPLVLFALVMAMPLHAQNPVYTDPDKADADFAIQGEYSGSLDTDEGAKKLGVQIIALGDGKFQGVGYVGGLPGDGWNGEEPERVDGALADGVAKFEGTYANGAVSKGEIAVTDKDGNSLGTLKRVERKSPTLGEKPPEAAVVLFDGTSADGWEGGKMTDDGLLMPGTTSKRRFGSHKVHIEFRLPYMPLDRGQGRGNSGIYVQGRYEVQMLDSFGLKGEHNECGGIYSVKNPDVNMCLPPLAWQTYDIEYTAAKFDGDKLVASPRVTVYHNGAKIHDDVELPGNRNTTAAPSAPGPEPGPVYVQDHGNPVRYRNIWVVEAK